MSLAIDCDKVDAVLLPDGWHLCGIVDGVSTFSLDAYEFTEQCGLLLLPGGQEGLVPSTGAFWLEAGAAYYCPLTSILALKIKRDKV